MCSFVLIHLDSTDITAESFWDAVSAFVFWCVLESYLANSRLEGRKLKRMSELSELSSSILEVLFVASLGIGNKISFLIASSPPCRILPQETARR